MRRRPSGLTWGVLAAVAVCGGCRSSPDPDTLFAQAEQLRLAYERSASEAAIARYRQALDAWTTRGNRPAAARAAERIGATHEQLGQLDASLRAYQQALSLGAESGDPILESEVRSHLGMAHARLSQLEQAATQCRFAVDLARRAGSSREEARALNCLGEVDYHGGDSERAVRSYRQAEALWTAAGDEPGRAETLLLLGSALSDSNTLDEAGRLLLEARAIWTALGHRRGEALTDLALASLRRQGARLRQTPGTPQDAAQQLAALRDRFRAAGDAVWEGAALSTLAYVYEEMGDGPRALRHWEAASRLFEAAGLQLAAIEMAIKIGTGYLRSDVATALDWLDKGRMLSEASGNDHLASWALRFIGVAHVVKGDARTGLDYLEQSLEVQQSFDDPLFRMRTLVDAGRAHRSLGNQARALAHFEDALTLSRAEGDRGTEARALFEIAGLLAGQNDLGRARRQVESALALAESIRTEAESSELQVSYLASVHAFHELHMDVLMRLHRGRPRAGLSARAFEASERARARSLLDSLAESGVDLRAGVDPDLLEREQMAKRAFEDWAARLRQVDGSPDPQRDAARLAEEHQGLEERYEQIQAEIRRRSPRYAALARPEPLGLADVQRQVLDANTILLEYALGEERSYLWTVSATDHASIELPPRAEIERAASRVYERLTARHAAGGSPEQRRARVERADAEYWHEAASLAEMVIAPVADRIRGKRLLVVADGMLQYIPFAALPAPGRHAEPRPLVVDHEIVNLPSASVLAVLRRETASRARPAREVAVLADPVFEADDPRLRAHARAVEPPGRPAGTARGSAPQSAPAVIREGSWTLTRLASTRREADAIVAAAPPGTTLSRMDFDASRAAALSPELAQYRIVHFATHGVLDNANPGLSGLILSLFDERGQPQDGFLRLHDIYGLQLPADLVVLSACDTALGRPVRGEGLMGMVRGFFYAGARRVVASLWKVDDEATGELMSRFYAGMLKGQQSPAAALRDAQLAVWRDARWRAPYHWAAFVLQGEWR